MSHLTRNMLISAPVRFVAPRIGYYTDVPCEVRALRWIGSEKDRPWWIYGSHTVWQLHRSDGYTGLSVTDTHTDKAKLLEAMRTLMGVSPKAWKLRRRRSTRTTARTAAGTPTASAVTTTATASVSAATA